MIQVKIHEKVVAMADSDLVGKELEEGELHLHVTERFYKGEEKSEEEIIAILKTADNLNIVGKEIVGIALKEGFINEDDIVTIKGVPHVQIYNLQGSE
jgi:uncharacterized protein